MECLAWAERSRCCPDLADLTDGPILTCAGTSRPTESEATTAQELFPPALRCVNSHPNRTAQICAGKIAGVNLRGPGKVSWVGNWLDSALVPPTSPSRSAQLWASYAPWKLFYLPPAMTWLSQSHPFRSATSANALGERRRLQKERKALGQDKRSLRGRCCGGAGTARLSRRTPVTSRVPISAAPPAKVSLHSCRAAMWQTWPC